MNIPIPPDWPEITETELDYLLGNLDARLDGFGRVKAAGYGIVAQESDRPGFWRINPTVFKRTKTSA